MTTQKIAGPLNKLRKSTRVLNFSTRIEYMYVKIYWCARFLEVGLNYFIFIWYALMGEGTDCSEASEQSVPPKFAVTLSLLT